jgi:hypothetical protein
MLSYQGKEGDGVLCEESYWVEWLFSEDNLKSNCADALCREQTCILVIAEIRILHYIS